MAKIRNPIGEKVSVGHGYSVQPVKLLGQKGYVKIWYKGEVVDRALTSAAARENIKRRLQSAFALTGD